MFTGSELSQQEIDNFQEFIDKYFEFSTEYSIGYMEMKDQYKIWSKILNHSQHKKLIDYMKNKYRTFLSKCDGFQPMMENRFYINPVMKEKIIELEKLVGELQSKLSDKGSAFVELKPRRKEEETDEQPRTMED